jgi:hypothetical protein
MDHSEGQERKPYCREVRRRAQVTASLCRSSPRIYRINDQSLLFTIFFQGIEKNLQELACGLRLSMYGGPKHDGFQNQ